MKDTDFLFLTAALRARESRMLSNEKIERMLDTQTADDAAKVLVDCGYPDLSGQGANRIEEALSAHRQDIFYELTKTDAGRQLLDLFRMKYDYHNVKVLVKSVGANVDSEHILSNTGRIGAKALMEAFISGERQDLPAPMRSAISKAVGVLSRTANPQLADIVVDKAYFAELLENAKPFGVFITDYVRLLIDSSNLRTLVRSLRTGKNPDFLKTALIPGGFANMDEIAALQASGGGLHSVFKSKWLADAARLGAEAMKGGAQTLFELACDNAGYSYIAQSAMLPFGPEAVLSYLVKLDWEIMTTRMILTGKLSGIAPGVIRERLRECHV